MPTTDTAERDALVANAEALAMDLDHIALNLGGTAKAGDTIRAILARLAAAEEDVRRMDWLEGEDDREQIAIVEREPLPRSLFRRNMLVTRTAIDAARTAERGGEG